MSWLLAAPGEAGGLLFSALPLLDLATRRDHWGRVAVDPCSEPGI